jgi:hypothetical protein
MVLNASSARAVDCTAQAGINGYDTQQVTSYGERGDLYIQHRNLPDSCDGGQAGSAQVMYTGTDLLSPLQIGWVEEWCSMGGGSICYHVYTKGVISGSTQCAFQEHEDASGQIGNEPTFKVYWANDSGHPNRFLFRYVTPNGNVHEEGYCQGADPLGTHVGRTWYKFGPSSMTDDQDNLHWYTSFQGWSDWGNAQCFSNNTSNWDFVSNQGTDHYVVQSGTGAC